MRSRRVRRVLTVGVDGRTDEAVRVKGIGHSGPVDPGSDVGGGKLPGGRALAGSAPRSHAGCRQRWLVTPRRIGSNTSDAT